MGRVIAIIAIAIVTATPALSPRIPNDVSGPPTKETYDAFSWQLFVGLNSPVRNKWIWSSFEHVDNYELTYKPIPGLRPTFSKSATTNDHNRQPQPAPTSLAVYQ